MRGSSEIVKDPGKVHCFTGHGIGHSSRSCRSSKSDEKSDAVPRKDFSGESFPQDWQSKKTEHANVADAFQDHLKSPLKSFLVHLRSSVAKHDCGLIKDSKEGTSKDTDVDSCPTDFHAVKVSWCMAVKGLEGDVDADPRKSLLIPELQAPLII